LISMRSNLRGIILAAAALAVTGTASAMSISYSVDIFAGGAQQAVPFSQTVTLQKFDTMGGYRTLNSVTILLSWAASGVIEVSNNDNTGTPNHLPISHDFTNAKITVPLSITAPTASIPVNVVLGPASGTAAGATWFTLPSGPMCLAPAGCYFPTVTTVTGLVASSTTPVSTSVDPANFGLYEGIGGATFDLTAASTGAAYAGSTDGAGTGHLSFGGTAMAGGTVTVLYDYSGDVPEPLTFVMVGTALVGIGFFTRRKRA
jgi:hypothetical protein